MVFREINSYPILLFEFKFPGIVRLSRPSFSLSLYSSSSLSVMPKKKSGARKKADKQKEVLRVIRTGGKRELGKWPCNALMECDQCGR